MSSWNLGRYFGIHVYLHWTFWLGVAYLAYEGLKTGGPSRMLYMLGLYALTFLCITWHEYGHVLMARRFGIRTKDITLSPIGGVARLDRMSEKPSEELLIAIAGPAVNVVIFIVLLAGLLVTIPYWTAGFFELAFPLSLLRDVGLTNLLLVLFNMIPAFPMDGGRVFRALLVPAFGRLTATRIAAGVGTVFACLFVFVGLMTSWYGLLILAPFILLLGQLELATVRMSEHQRQAPVLDAISAEEDILQALPPDFDPDFCGLKWDSQAKTWVLWQNGKPVHTYRAMDPA